LLNRNSITRLCYAGSVLHTRPSGLHATREPLQIGAEIYGHAGLEADVEIQELALTSLQLAGFQEIRMDLCHAGILYSIVQAEPKALSQVADIIAFLRAKDLPGLRNLSADYAAETRAALLALPLLYGDAKVIAKAREILPALPGIKQALDELAQLASSAVGAEVTIDLADLQGYQYERGAMFALYVPDLPNAVARGGRYDHVGEAFGRARPATGFSMDLRELSRLMPALIPKTSIRAPWDQDPSLRAAIQQLRQAGEVVIQSLPGHDNEQDEFDCDRSLTRGADGKWILTN
jgi:ATP phosphoribosyltransferase regulatory subunit